MDDVIAAPAFGVGVVEFACGRMAALFVTDLDIIRFPVETDELYDHCICRISPRRQNDILKWVVACPDRFLYVKFEISLWVVSWFSPESVKVSIAEIYLFNLLKNALSVVGRYRYL